VSQNILYDALKIFHSLSNIKYNIVLGKNKNTISLNIEFLLDNFYHLVGLHKLIKSYNFQKLPHKEVLNLILSQKITIDTIKSDPAFQIILPRIKIILDIEQMLKDSNTLFFKFNYRRIRINSKIKADYLAKGKVGDKTVAFAFMVNDNNRFIINSVFPISNYDYTKNQTHYTTLIIQKIYIDNGQIETIFVSPKYKKDRK